jgi:UDP-glucose 4-epimerase
MKIIITGGCGYIGTHLVKKLENSHHVISVMDVVDHRCDIREINDCLLNMEPYKNHKYDAIIHLAALISVPESIKEPLNYHNTNVNGFMNVLEIARLMGINRVVYASSAAVDEISSFYGFTKYINEEYAKFYYKHYNIETIGLRFYNVYGGEISNRNKYSSVMISFEKCIIENKPITIYGDGTQTRDFIHIDDVTEALIKALTTKNNNCYGKIYNIGTGESTSIVNLANLMNEKSEILFEPERLGDVKHSIADTSKTITELGFTPKHKLINRM